jgi:hypothetical protein
MQKKLSNILEKVPIFSTAPDSPTLLSLTRKTPSNDNSFMGDKKGKE